MSDMSAALGAEDFPEGTALHAFCAWNQRRWRRDRRFILINRLHRLLQREGRGEGAIDRAAARLLAGRGRPASPEALAAARRLAESFAAALGSPEIERHAAVFRGFEELEERVAVAALARSRPRLVERAPSTVPRRILVIKLSALGDFVQALGPAAAIRRHHGGDHVTLLTSAPYAELGRRSGWFDTVMVDERPGWYLGQWLALRSRLREARFDRVYDLQTSDRSNAYFRLLGPERRPQWSGIARGCSHPHANLGRDPLHTIDKQAEQLLMAGIHPVPLPAWPAAAGGLPANLAGSAFALLIPGSSPRHPAKRWPADRYGALAARLHGAGLVPVILGSAEERGLGAAIAAACPAAVDLVGATDLPGLARLAQATAVTIGNDTGATHLATAAGSPVLVLFSAASDPSRCAPRGALVRVIRVPDLTALGVEDVAAAALAIARTIAPADAQAP